MSTFDYGTSTGYALGAALSISTANYENNVFKHNSLTTNTYQWWDGAVQNTIQFKPNTSQSTTNTSTYYYDQVGGQEQLTRVNVADGRPRNIYYKSTIGGLIIDRDEADNSSNGDPRELWYRFGGREMGYVGNNGTLNTHYDASISNRSATQGTGAFRNGETYGDSYADFDQSVSYINSYEQGSSASGYTVRAGETLSSIAANLWGDSSLWYKLAEVNGLSGDASLAEGQVLNVPAGVLKNTHNASTFQPYDPNEAIGETAPTTPKAPKPKKNKCGGFGQVLLAVIAIAVTIWTAGAALTAMGAGTGSIFGTGLSFLAGGSAVAAPTAIAVGAAAGAAGSIVSQGVGVATGIQDKFSWNAVALAAIGGGVGASGFGRAVSSAAGGGAVGAFASGAASSAITQGIGVAAGLQKEFSWAGVAAAGVGAAVGFKVGQALRLGDHAVGTAGHFTRSLATNTASSIANAATRSLIEGTSFGDNILAGLPDVIGQTIGEAIAGGIAQARTNRHIDRLLDQAGIEGNRGDTQQSRAMVGAMLSHPDATDARILEILSDEGLRTNLERLDRALARGISPEEAARRGREWADGAPDAIDLAYDEIIVEGIGPNGPGGRSIITDTISGGIGLADSFVTYADNHPVTAGIAFAGVSVVLGGPTKTILRRLAGEAGDNLIEQGANAFGNVVRGVVTNIATRHKWTVALTVAGHTTNAEAGTIGGVAGGLASLTVDVAAGGLGQVVDRVKDIRSAVRGGTYVLRDADGAVVRSGRTRNLDRRQAEHARDPTLSQYDFEPVHRTDSYAEQRGLEQVLHDQYNPPLNRIRPISPTNPRRQEYESAAERFLRENDGQ